MNLCSLRLDLCSFGSPFLLPTRLLFTHIPGLPELVRQGAGGGRCCHLCRHRRHKEGPDWPRRFRIPLAELMAGAARLFGVSGDVGVPHELAQGALGPCSVDVGLSELVRTPPSLLLARACGRVQYCLRLSLILLSMGFELICP